MQNPRTAIFPLPAMPLVSSSAADATPWIIAGMHRSGTSLTGGLLRRMGVNLGENLVPADRANPSGYHEDLDFVEFHRRMLATCSDPRAPGWADWGWSESGIWREPDFPIWETAARALIAPRIAEGKPWGWKDPRSTLFLDFWARLLPSARFILVYRPPWEVADSMQRVEGEVFRSHPTYAHAIWCDYNRRLLAFQQRHPQRCVLISSNALTRAPNALPRLLRTRFGVDFPGLDLASSIESAEFATLTGADAMYNLLQRTHTDSLVLLDQLEHAADVPSGGVLRPVDRLRFANTTRPEPAGKTPARCAIIIPCYNYGEFLVEAVASVERHAPDDCEFIIVDDGSTEPRTQSILAALRELGYRVLSQSNQGVSPARNAAIAATRADFILPLDADNRLRHGYIQNALRILAAHPEVGVVYGDRQEFGARNGRVRPPEFDPRQLLRFNTIDVCAVYRREIWTACGGYDSRAIWEDWELWIHASKLGWRFVHWPEVGFDYRVHTGSLSDLSRRPEDATRRKFAYMYHKHEDFYRRHLPETLDLDALYELHRLRSAPPKSSVAQKIREHIQRVGWAAWRPLGIILWHKLKKQFYRLRRGSDRR